MSTLLAKRHKARRLLVQALYQRLVTDNDLDDIKLQIAAENNPEKYDGDYFETLLFDIPKHRESLEEKIEQHGALKIKELDPIERVILWIGSYEIAHRLDIPDSVAISEGLKLANCFGNEKSYQYINAVLDKIAKSA